MKSIRHWAYAAANSAPASFAPSHVPKPKSFRHKHPRGYSKSNLEPVLREQGALKRPPGARKQGRPRILATWFPAVVAQAMADGPPGGCAPAQRDRLG